MTRRSAACAAIIVLILLAALGLTYIDRLEPRAFAVPGLDDRALHLATIERLRAREPYYEAVGTELRLRGYPAASIPNWRTPLHYWFVAVVGVERSGRLLAAAGLLAIALAALACRCRSLLASLMAVLILSGTMLAKFVPSAAATSFAEQWAGVLIALSLALYLLRWNTAAAVLGVLSVFMRELAVPYALACGVLAIRGGRRRESAVWVVGGVLYGSYYALHVLHVSQAIQPSDYAWTHSWVRWLGWSFVLQTAWVSGWTLLLPPIATPIAAPLALAGTAARSMPPQLRVTLLGYTVLFCAVGQEFNFYWGWVTAPLWSFSLLYSPEGLSTLIKTAWPRTVGNRTEHQA